MFGPVRGDWDEEWSGWWGPEPPYHAPVVDIAGGASTVRQALAAGVIDELTLDIAPVLLGSGERIFDGAESFGFEPAEVLHSPLTTHIRYRRVG
jgi:dihydrofolate reductase